MYVNWKYTRNRDRKDIEMVVRNASWECTRNRDSNDS